MFRFLFIVAFTLLPGSGVRACPSGLFAEELKPRIEGARNGLRLFVKSESKSGKAQWSDLPIQVDPVDEEGRLKFFDTEKWKNEDSQKTDLMTFKVLNFGNKISYKKDQLPCRGPITYQLRDKFRRKYAYLTNCGSQKSALPALGPVKFENAKNLIVGKNYKYVFNPKNYMQFQTIGFLSEASAADSKVKPLAADFPDNKEVDRDFDLIALDSKMLIHADFQNFVTMNFDSSDITSVLEAKRIGPVGAMARVSFWLKVLFFKLDLRLNTNVGFYEDSGHIPMMVSLPVDARKYLNNGSGIVYSWLESDLTKASEKIVLMPEIDEELIKKGPDALGESGIKYCKKGFCTYEYNAVIQKRRLRLGFIIEEKLVKMGFFPQFVSDVSEHTKSMNWDFELAESKNRLAVYFETSGLPKGGHPWDFWLTLGDKKKGAMNCPHPIRFHRIPSSRLKGPVSR